MLTRAEFEEALIPLRAALEARRRLFLRYFAISIIIACLLLVSALFFPLAVLGGIQHILHMLKAPATQDVTSYRLFALLASISISLSPLFSYRGERGFSVQRIISARLLNLFSAFMPAQGGALTEADLRRTHLFASSLLFLPEEGAMGEMNGVRIRFCDASLSRREDKGDKTVFTGLLILCEPLNPRAWRPSEALSGVLKECLARIAEANREHKVSPLRWDEKLTYAVHVFFARCKETMSWRMGKDELPSEREYRLKYSLSQPFIRPVLPLVQDAICEDYLLEYTPEACLAAIAGDGAFFALGSLFTPALEESRMRHFYSVIEEMDRFTQYLAASSGFI